MLPFDGDVDRLLEAAERTRVIRAPQKRLHTFGASRFHYYIVTEPAYREIVPGIPEAVVREGDVESRRPAVVTPSYMARLEGFGDDAYRYFSDLGRQFGHNSPGLLYSYTNEPGPMNIVEGTARDVAERVSDRLTAEKAGLSAVIEGVDELWDVSLLKFIFEYTMASAAENAGELRQRGLLSPDPQLGVPKAAIHGIEDLFRRVVAGQADPSVLKRELDRWDLFELYQDRFFGLFGKRPR